MPVEQYSNDAVTTLAATITNGDLTLSVANVLGFPTAAQFRIRVDNEIMLVTGVSGATWTVTRAVEPCGGLQIAAPHAAGATVTHVLTRASLISLGGTAITLTGDVTGSGTGSAVTTLTVTLNNIPAATGNVSVNSHKLTNVTDPTSAQDAATKNYVDTHAGGMTIGGNVTGATAGSAGNGFLYADTSSPGKLHQTIDIIVSPANDGTGQLNINNGGVVSPYFNINFLLGSNFGITILDSGVNYQLYLCDLADGACLIAIDYSGNQTWLGDGTNALKVIGTAKFTGNLGFFGASPASQQTGGVASAGGSYTATEQAMLDACYQAMRTYGLLT